MTVPKQVKKRTSGYESFDSLQSLTDIAQKTKSGANPEVQEEKGSRQSKKLKMSPIDDKGQKPKPKAIGSQAPSTTAINKNSNPVTVRKKDVTVKPPVPVALTKSNVAKLSSSQTNVKKRSRAWDDDSAVDFSKLM